jgi:hypothetical protein
MDGTAPTWSTLRELVGVVLAPQQLTRTVCIALVVGTVFFAMNHLAVILYGRATAVVWIKAVLTYLTPPGRLQSRHSVSHATADCARKITSNR